MAVKEKETVIIPAQDDSSSWADAAMMGVAFALIVALMFIVVNSMSQGQRPTTGPVPGASPIVLPEGATVPLAPPDRNGSNH